MKINCLILLILQIIFCKSTFAETAAIPAPPKIDASAYLIMDFDSGQLLASENIDQRIPPASLTKMMTIYVAASELAENKIHLDDKVVVSEKAWRMLGSRMFIEVNKEVTVGDLLKGIIIQSGNDASVALAEYISGDEDVFAELMNQHASRLGLTNSHFTDSSGLPNEQHYTTAYDMAILAAALIRDFPDIYALHSEREFTYNGITQQNRNSLLWLDKTVDGIKTGHTEEAGYCLVTSAKRDDMRLISVVMGSKGEKARTETSLALLNYGFRFYETRKLFSANEILTTAKIWKGDTDSVGLGLTGDLYITIPRGQFENINTVFDLPERMIAPIAQGDEKGKVKLILSDKEIVSRPLFAMQSIAQGGLFSRLKDDIRMILQ